MGLTTQIRNKYCIHLYSTWSSWCHHCATWQRSGPPRPLRPCGRVRGAATGETTVFDRLPSDWFLGRIQKFGERTLLWRTEVKILLGYQLSKRGVVSTMKFSHWFFADSSKVQGVCHWPMFIYRCFCFGDCWHGISLRVWVDKGCTKSVTLLWSTACNFDVFEYDACFELGNCSQPYQCKLCRIYHVSPVTTSQWLVRFTEEILYMKNVGYVRYKDMCKK